MELRHLRYFTALGEQLSFTRAATLVHVTQPTLSHQIRQLEDELGVRLFDRTGKRVALTEQGELLLPSITRALNDIDGAIRALRTGTEALAGTLAVGAVHSVHMRMMPACAATFLARHPDVRLVIEDLAAPVIEARVGDGTLDVGIAYAPAADDALVFEPLYEEELVLAVTAAHPLATRRRVRMSALHRTPLILLTRNFATRRMLDGWFAAAGIAPNVIVEMNTIGSMLEMARRSDIAAIVPHRAVAADADLVPVAIEAPTPRRVPGLLWPRSRARSAGARSFAAILRRAVRREVDRDRARRPRAAGGG
ncbi:LysR substrate-binding domain-containing protein [Rhodoplanes sp. TEM]|uniref:LysR substrate-binding domain-containing protein n=1 Tax=Rhodoplanes tepidamans TaxID=200616 RepID=A0ABT5JHL4_RHOTP|nr:MULTISPECIES: LysR substrate-binding domain-containing protein [Rhodoplanes]MDC7788898.1 LysR substrate-binding domain-containing protein [Rhodoplanes tepidamans]MDC7985605.1 LysR substrate-binding domain-containing protein [Rhodoplanes sp. TEM]MDQ0358767.1 LysR family cyn operon transcriptional activator [Rhodoplanes tepidamans]